MTQFPVNLNDATTGHKLQGSSKDHVIISSWLKTGLFKNWVYTVLSRVQTLDELYLLEPIDMERSFKPSKQFRSYLKRDKTRQAKFISNREKNMNEYYKQDWN